MVTWKWEQTYFYFLHYMPLHIAKTRQGARKFEALTELTDKPKSHGLAYQGLTDSWKSDQRVFKSREIYQGLINIPSVAGAVPQSPLFLIIYWFLNLLILWFRIFQKMSIPRARELTFWENVHPSPSGTSHMSHVMCHMSHVICQASHVTCQVLHVNYNFFF